MVTEVGEREGFAPLYIPVYTELGLEGRISYDLRCQFYMCAECVGALRRTLQQLPIPGCARTITSVTRSWTRSRPVVSAGRRRRERCGTNIGRRQHFCSSSHERRQGLV